MNEGSRRSRRGGKVKFTHSIFHQCSFWAEITYLASIYCASQKRRGAHRRRQEAYTRNILGAQASNEYCPGDPPPGWGVGCAVGMAPLPPPPSRPPPSSRRQGRPRSGYPRTLNRRRGVPLARLSDSDRIRAAHGAAWISRMMSDGQGADGVQDIDGLRLYLSSSNSSGYRGVWKEARGLKFMTRVGGRQQAAGAPARRRGCRRAHPRVRRAVVVRRGGCTADVVRAVGVC